MWILLLERTHISAPWRRRAASSRRITQQKVSEPTLKTTPPVAIFLA